MRVVVTGGSGLAGRAVVDDLMEHGFDVVNVDLVPGDGPAPFRRADLVDLGQVYGCMREAQAVVHFAAIPRPTLDVPEVVFRTNVMSAFNVLEAASALGISRVVSASSVSVLGFPFFAQPFAPDYVPIDEAHPLLPQDAYALSKRIGEELAAGFARRGGLSVVSLRFPWIHTPRTFAEQVRAPLERSSRGGIESVELHRHPRCGRGDPSGPDGGDRGTPGLLRRRFRFVHADPVASVSGRSLPDDRHPG
jgi:nucleoside-diphosphate-sugar epimerase